MTDRTIADHYGAGWVAGRERRELRGVTGAVLRERVWALLKEHSGVRAVDVVDLSRKRLDLDDYDTREAIWWLWGQGYIELTSDRRIEVTR